MARKSEVCPAFTQHVPGESLPIPSSADCVPASGNTQSVVEPTQVLGHNTASPLEVVVHARLVNLETREVYELGDGSSEIPIGRHPHSRVLIEDHNVSSRHCRIYRDKFSYVVRDTSSNGTFLNGSRLSRDEVRRIKSGDLLALILPDHPRYLFAFVESSSASASALRATPISGAPAAAAAADTPRPQLIVAGTEGAGVEDQRGGSSIDDFNGRFQMVRSIGKGNFSEVFLCVERSTGNLMAAKVVDTAKTELFTKRAKSSSIDIQSECRLLAAVSHPHIVSFVAMYRQDSKLYIVTEFMDGGDLLTRLIDKGRFDDASARNIFTQIASGLKYLHVDKNITIRDLKPENILLNKDASVLKLADFGLARELKEAAGEGAPRTYCGTPSYFAPEMFKLQRHEVRSYGAKEVDIWSMGVVLYVILSARPPFSDEDLAGQVERGAFDFDCPEFEGVTDLAKDLVTKCMQVDPKKRLTVEEVLQHPWLVQHEKPKAADADADAEPPRKKARLETEKENADN